MKRLTLFVLSVALALCVVSCASAESPRLMAKATILEIRQGNWSSALGPALLAVGKCSVRLKLMEPERYKGTELVLGVTEDSQLILAGAHRLAIGDVIVFRATGAVLADDVAPAVFSNIEDVTLFAPLRDEPERSPRKSQAAEIAPPATEVDPERETAGTGWLVMDRTGKVNT